MSAEAVIGFLTGVVKRRRAQQAGVLYLASLGTLAMSFIGSIVVTRILGPHGYGDLKFVLNSFSFITTIATFGVFATGAQVLAQRKHEDEGHFAIAGGLIVIALRIGAASMLLAALFGAFQPMVFQEDLRFLIILFSPLLLVLLMDLCLEAILQGENRVHQMSLQRFLPASLYVVLMLALSRIWTLTPAIVLALQGITSAAVIASLLRTVHPRFADIRANTAMLWHANKGYGRHLYVGTLSAVATGYLSTFLIAYFLDNTQLGFFSLAVTLTLPLNKVAGVLGTTYFKDFAQVNVLPRRVTLMALGVAGGTLLLFLVLVRPLVLLVYTEAFAPVALLAGIVAVGSVCEGFGDYINRFLGAHARGKELRNGAIAVGTVNVIGYILLVPLVGVTGAAATKLASGLVYCSMMVLYYRRFRATASEVHAVQ